MRIFKLALLSAAFFLLIQNMAFGAVLIHEIAPGCNGVSTAEFVELYNTGSEPVNLSGWMLSFRGRTSSSDSGTITLSGTIPAGGYFLITGRDYSSLVGQPINGNTSGILFPIGDQDDTGVVVGKLSASAAQLGLKNAEGTLVDAAGYGIDPAYTGIYVETLSKSTGTGFSSRRSVSRDNATHGDTNNNSADFIYPASDAIPGAMTPTNSNTVEAPVKAWNPNPVNNAVNVATTKTLSWNAGAGAVSHNVYFGTTSPGTLQGNQTTATFTPGSLATGTTYYWRIDEVTATETITGDVWQFETTGPQPGGYVYLTWKNDPTNSIVVNWWNPNAPGDSNVQYGLTPAYGMNAYNPTVSNWHYIELTGLTPGATYHYKTSSSDGVDGNDATFTVPLRNRTSFKFAVAGDNRSPDPPADPTPFINRHQMLCNWLAARDYEFVIQTGDMINEGGVVLDWVNFYKAEKNLGKSKVIMPAVGNHEFNGSSPWYYNDFYAAGLPTNGPAGNNGKVYSFNYGNAHFVSLCSIGSQVNFTSQTAWLAADLAAASADPNIVWKFIYMHNPIYSAGTHGGDKTELAYWGAIIDQYQVDMVFAGHCHLYERSYPIKADQIDTDGTYYVTSGLGGADFTTQNAAQPDFPFMPITHAGETLAVCITINGNELTLEAIANANDQVYDTLHIVKGPEYDPADFNHDGWVDVKDLAELVSQWLDDGMWP
jgi:hypothetical protein